jgi:hypothetical protein
MKKLFSAILITAGICLIAFAQGTAPQINRDSPSQGIAPKEPNGIGRADVRVSDEKGSPVRNAFVKLESTRTDGFFCESWGGTNDSGVIILPPIHMGSLKLRIKAKGYRSTLLEVPTNQLGDPIRVTLRKK